jgi:hypothetical protein
MVYLIKCTVSNVCKIGFSDNPKERIQNLQTSYPWKLELISTLDGDISLERFIHNHFKEFNTSGEWFQYNESIKHYFDNYTPDRGLMDKFQRNADGYFDATALLTEFNSLNNNTPRKMEDFKKLKETKDLSDYLVVNGVSQSPIVSSLKGTWMHPFVFIDFAMWLSIAYKVRLLTWFFNNKTCSINLTGDYYKEMCTELMNQRNVLQKETTFYHCIQEVNILKDLCGITTRNKMTEIQLNTLNLLQKANIKLIKLGLSKEKRYTELKNFRNLIE